MRTLILVELPELTLDTPTYTEAENQLAEVEGATETGKKKKEDGGSHQVVSYLCPKGWPSLW